MEQPQQPRWHKSSWSGPDNQCVELAHTGLVRDSKNPGGPSLVADLRVLVRAVKDELITR